MGMRSRDPDAASQAVVGTEHLVTSKRIDTLLAIDITDNERTAECCICLQQLGCEKELVQLSCKHIMHRNCTEHWLMHRIYISEAKCPLCKANVFDAPVDIAHLEKSGLNATSV